jgi:hypothetical protein
VYLAGEWFGVEQMAMEVWEVEETRQRKVVSGVLERPVSHCCVLETSKFMSSCQDDAAATALHCDLLLVILPSSSRIRVGDNGLNF